MVVSALAVSHLGWSGQPHVSPPFSGWHWLSGWAQWDAGWYANIVDNGYSYLPGKQSSVVFFPAYPLAVRPVAALVGTYPAGVLVGATAGVGAIALFATWCRDRLAPGGAWTAVCLLALYPYSFFLFGAVYADSLFVLAAIAAFVLVERGHPWLAGLAGAAATGARPMGVVVAIALLLRFWERARERGDLEPDSPQRRRCLWGAVGVATSVLGLAAFALFLWARFDDPLAMVHGQSGWDQEAGPATWLKFQFFEDVTDVSSPLSWLSFVAHPVLTAAGLASVPFVWRRFGRSYGLYVALLVGLSALSTKNFFGMARYLLAAFPCFAVAGERLWAVPRVRASAVAASGLGLVLLTAAFSRGYYLS